MSGVGQSVECLLIADDLTGACDAGVQFALRGRRTVVSLGLDRAPGGAHVLALSTDSRDLEPAAVPALMKRVAASLARRGARIVFKKIDSTLRGNGGCEIAAAVEAFECDAAIVTPAFPAMGRVVRSGWLAVASDPAFLPINLRGWLESQGATPCRHLAPADLASALHSGLRFLSVDAGCEQDLARIVAAGLRSGRRLLWAGSAGLAAALASAMPGEPIQVAGQPKSEAGVLFCIGSDHPVTTAQESRLLASRPSVLLHPQNTSGDAVASTISRGEHVILRIPRGRVTPQTVRTVIADARPAALVLSGGDTASLVCRAIDAHSIELRREIVTGIPQGILRGGLFDATAVATKSGGFGMMDDLIKVADYFHASKPGV